MIDLSCYLQINPAFTHSQSIRAETQLTNNHNFIMESIRQLQAYHYDIYDW